MKRSAGQEFAQFRRFKLPNQPVVKETKRTEKTQDAFERQAATLQVLKETDYRASSSEDLKTARQDRYQQRLDISDLNEFLLNLRAEQLEQPFQGLQTIPDSFADGPSYIKNMQPAFLEEVRADISGALAQASYSRASLVRLTITSSQKNLCYLSVVEDVDKNRPMFQATFNADDFVLLVQKSSQPLTDWRGTGNYFFAVCEHLYDGERRFSPQVHLKVASKNSVFVTSLTDFYVVWVECLITIVREFKMIRLTEWSDMTPYVFTPSCRRIPHRLTIPQSYFSFLHKNFNDSQVRAIEEACNIHSGVTLIQGPPGTGKTHTILGIISAFLLSTGYAANRPKVLVCAPSNAAIDELARRVVLSGLYDENGAARQDIKCVRLSAWTKEPLDFKARKNPTKEDPPEEVQQIMLSSLVTERLMSSSDTTDPVIVLDNLRKEVQQIEQDIEKAKKTRNKRLLEELICRRRDVEDEIYKERMTKHTYEESRRAASVGILSRADVVFTTLSGAFSKDMELTGGGWHFVIVDEACQALELATLIPMQYGAKNTVLIGDPMQLPGITFSQQSTKSGFNRSLFERMMSAGCPVTMLEVQYRMAPSIRSFPSFYFYHNKLRDAREVVSRTQPYWLPSEAFVFIDLLTSKEIREGSDISMKNYSEAEFIVNLYLHYKPYHGTGLDIGVITPYKSQVHTIRRLLEDQCGSNYKKDIEVNTVDGFQGREKAVIIFSCVRSGDFIGFLSDRRRLNVAITRAKYGLWVVGRAQSLLRQVTWRDFVGLALQDGVLVKARTQLEIPPMFVVRPPQLQLQASVPHYTAPLPQSAFLPIRVDKPSASLFPTTRLPLRSESAVGRLQPPKSEAPPKLLEMLVSKMKSQMSELQEGRYRGL
jgi:hypothetical protein